jgi:hypothetical protein
VVESTALEMRRTGNRTVGSNPTLSATAYFAEISQRSDNPQKSKDAGATWHELGENVCSCPHPIASGMTACLPDPPLPSPLL